MSDLSNKTFPGAARISPGKRKEKTGETIKPHTMYVRHNPNGSTVYAPEPKARQDIQRAAAIADEMAMAAREKPAPAHVKNIFNAQARPPYNGSNKKNKSDDFEL